MSRSCHKSRILVNGFKCRDPVIKAERICPVKNTCPVTLAQVVLAGIVPNWPADKILQVYEICISDEVVKVQLRGDIQSRWRKS